MKKKLLLIPFLTLTFLPIFLSAQATLQKAKKNKKTVRAYDRDLRKGDQEYNMELYRPNKDAIQESKNNKKTKTSLRPTYNPTAEYDEEIFYPEEEENYELENDSNNVKGQYKSDNKIEEEIKIWDEKSIPSSRKRY